MSNFQYVTFEKDEIEVEMNGTKHLCFLVADLGINTYPYDPEIEAPSFDTVEIIKATTTITFYDHETGQELGTITKKGVGFFNDFCDACFQIDNDGILIEN
jgi:hypothetical protein